MPLYKNMTTKASSNKKKEVFFKKVEYRFSQCWESSFKNDFRIEFASKMEKKEQHHEKSCTEFGCEFFLLE